MAYQDQIMDGLGQTPFPNTSNERPPTGRSEAKRKPNLKLDLNHEKPPPPPPKSPRHHSRSSSVRSRSSLRVVSPLSVSSSVSGSAIGVTFHGQSTQLITPPDALKKQVSYFPPTEGSWSGQVMGASSDECRRLEKPALPPVPNDVSDVPPPTPRKNSTAKPLTAPNALQGPASSMLPPASNHEPALNARLHDIVCRSGANAVMRGRAINQMRQLPLKDPLAPVMTLTLQQKTVAEAPSSALRSGVSRPTSCGPDHLMEVSTAVSVSKQVAAVVAIAGPPTTMPSSGSIRKITSDALKSPLPPLPKDSTTLSLEIERILNPESQDVEDASKASPVVETDPALKAALMAAQEAKDQAARLGVIAKPLPVPHDPRDRLRDLARQSEALYERYSHLRAERHKISSGILAKLKEQQAGPEYANLLLDQQLALSAIQSSMDICFAKLKSLDCRKEEAITALLAQFEAQELCSENAAKLAHVDTGIVHCRSAPTSEFAETTRSAVSADATTPKAKAHERKSSSSIDTVKPTRSGSISGESNNHIRHDTMAQIERTAETLSPPVIRPESVSSAEETEDEQPKRIRVKGAKAAKVLGLMAKAENGRPDSPGSITLPDGLESPRSEVELHVSKKTRAPATVMTATDVCRVPSPGPPPAHAPPPLPRPRTDSDALPRTLPIHKGTDASVAISANSSAESSPNTPEAVTPSQEDIPGLRSAKRGMVQTIQVFVDDDVLDYYEGPNEFR